MNYVPENEAVQTSRGYAEFGPQNLRVLPHDKINILRQIRSELNQDKIAELADSIPLRGESEGVQQYDLMQTPDVGSHTEESASSYLSQLNLAWGTEYSLEDLTPYETPDGVQYLILIAGERRYRATGVVIERDKLAPDSGLLCAVEDNISFIEAFPRQYIENNARVNPSPADEARAIRVYLDAVKQLDPKFTKAECARRFGVRPETVYDALVFTDFPQSMQDLVGEYSYSSVIQAKEIYELYRDHYKAKEGQGDETLVVSDGSLGLNGAEDAATYEVVTCFLRVKAELLRRRMNQYGKRYDLSLKAQAERIREGFEQEALGIGVFGLPGLDEEETILTRRRDAGNGLFAAVHSALLLLEQLNLLPEDKRNKLGRFAILPDLLESNAVSMEEFEAELAGAA